jgi:HEAT repeat protein
MNHVVKRLFRLHDGEERKVLQFAALGGIVQAGLAIGISAADSLFLVNVGADKLPIVYLITPAIMLAYIPLYAYLMGRFGIERLFKITLYLIAIGGVLLFVLLTLVTQNKAGASPIYFVIKIYCGLWFIALYTLVWNFIDGYFDILDAKRLFAFFSGGMAFGTIIGGALVPILLLYLEVKQLMLIWSALAIAALPLLRHVRNTWPRIESEESRLDDDRVSVTGQIGIIIHAVRSSKYFRYIVLAFLSTLMVTTICEFQYMRVFEQGRTAEQVAALFGHLYAMVSCLGLVINLFVFNRLVSRLGVRNTALIQPIVYAVVFSYLLLDFGFGAAVAGFVAYQGVLTSIDYNNQNFLFNALPTRGKAVLRTFIEGLCEPFATALVGVSLYFFAPRLSPESISVIGLGGVVVAIAAVFGLRSHYTTAIVANLREAWLNFSTKNSAYGAPLTVTEIEHAAEASTSDTTRVAVAAIRMLSRHDKQKGVDALLRFVENRDPGDQASAAVVLTEILEESDPDIFRRLVFWYAGNQARLTPAMLEVCGRFHILGSADIESLMKARDPTRRRVAALSLWSSRRLDVNLKGYALTNEMLRGAEADRAAAVRIIGKSGQTRYAVYVAAFLRDPALGVRQEAARAISVLATESADSIVDPVLESMCFCDREMRVSGFETLTKIGSTRSIRKLISLSPLFTADEVRQAEAVIHAIGLESVPILTAMVGETDQPLSSRSIVWRVLSRLAFPQFEALAPDLIESLLTRAYACLYARFVLNQEAAGNDHLMFLRDCYRSQDTALVEAILEILTISGRLFNFEQMASSLRSTDVKERGNAIETIEQACPHEVFTKLLPLLLTLPLEERVALSISKTHDELPSIAQVLRSAMESNEPLESAAGFMAAWTYSPAKETSPPPLGKEEIHSAMKQKLDTASSEMLDAVIFSLLSRETPLSTCDRSAAPEEMNAVERACILSQTAFFNALDPPELMDIAHASTLSTIQGGSALFEESDKSAHVYALINGEISEEAEGNPEHRHQLYRLLGEAHLKGGGTRPKSVRAGPHGLVVCSVPVKAVQDAMLKYPNIGITLFAFKLGVDLKSISSAGV